MIRVLVCGGRDWTNWSAGKAVLDTLFPEPVFVIHGDADGADRIGELWAWGKGYPSRAFPAQWKTYGRAAGYRRNREMVAFGEPDVVVAFPGGWGTLDMIAHAHSKNIPIIEIPDLL